MNGSFHRLCTLVLLVVFAVVGCGSVRAVVPFALDPGTLVAPADALSLTTHEEAVRAIAAILVNDLEMPIPGEFRVYVYAGRHAFAQGLVQDARVSTRRAAELSEFAVGIGRPRQLFLNDNGSERGRDWLRLIAHELAHLSQFEIAQGEGLAEQWLAEGAAEWVAFSVLQRLGRDTMIRRRQLATAGIRNHAALVAARLDLETLGNPRGFMVRHLREGSLPTYQLAFLMADYLIERDGVERVVQYFHSFSRRHDRHANFSETFGQSLEEFEQEVLRHLMALVARVSVPSPVGLVSRRDSVRPSLEGP